ncbi:MAG TPA: hypothetical protein VEN29_11710 [Casimicrobiaceae bacterium]|nr:hypothetical protein [Casimicrobiaceae bacterium]
MGALVKQFLAAGVTLEPTGDGNLRARGKLTDELRAAIRTHKPAILAELSTAANDAPKDKSLPDPETEHRRAKALALLQANPTWQRAVVAEAGDPVIIGIAIRGVAYGELEIPGAKYDPIALLALVDEYGRSTH